MRYRVLPVKNRNHVPKRGGKHEAWIHRTADASRALRNHMGSPPLGRGSQKPVQYTLRPDLPELQDTAKSGYQNKLGNLPLEQVS